MKLNQVLIIQLFDELARKDSSLCFALPCRESDDLLKEWKVPFELRELLNRHWVRDDRWINTAYIKPLHSIVDINQSDPRAIKDGLLIIGGASNGDPMAVDILSPNGAIGFISHESYWEGGEARTMFALIDTDLAHAMKRLFSDNSFPFDYYEAKELQETEGNEPNAPKK